MYNLWQKVNVMHMQTNLQILAVSLIAKYDVLIDIYY